MAVELGEAANGGQVLLSHDAWLRLQDRMHEASFPVVEQLGSYKLNAWPVPLPVYQACLLPLPTTSMSHHWLAQVSLLNRALWSTRLCCGRGKAVRCKSPGLSVHL